MMLSFPALPAPGQLGQQPYLPCLAMDQDYERRLLRQIVIQNENTMPCVSTWQSALPVLAWPGLVELVGRRGGGVVGP